MLKKLTIDQAFSRLIGEMVLPGTVYPSAECFALSEGWRGKPCVKKNQVCCAYFSRKV